MKIIGTGLSGLVGSRLLELSSPDEYTFQNLSLETGVDITNKDVLYKYIKDSQAPWVFHFAAKTDVDDCEKEKELGNISSSWIVNVEATKNIVEICHETKKHMLYISTDFVFDGKKDFYEESDVPNPLGWYGQTKFQGEELVKSLESYGLIIRIAYPYRSYWPGKADFVHKILERFKNMSPISSPTDQIITPTHIDDIVYAIRALVVKSAFGIYHVVGNSSLSPYNAACKIAEIYNYPINSIDKTTFSKFYHDRAPRPLRTKLKNDRITKCGISMKDFDSGIHAIHSQEKL